MAGGPINGVPVTGMLGGLGAGAVTAIDKNQSSNDESRYLGIIVPTVLQLSTEALNYWTSMTCLYDRYWTAEPRSTSPAQGIEAESPQEARSASEDLEWKARFARRSGGQMRPYLFAAACF